MKELTTGIIQIPSEQNEVVIFKSFWNNLHQNLQDKNIVEPNSIPDTETLPGEYPTKDLPTLSNSSPLDP